jgi:hypothetical protein
MTICTAEKRQDLVVQHPTQGPRQSLILKLVTWRSAPRQ